MIKFIKFGNPCVIDREKKKRKLDRIDSEVNEILSCLVVFYSKIILIKMKLYLMELIIKKE